MRVGSGKKLPRISVGISEAGSLPKTYVNMYFFSPSPASQKEYSMSRIRMLIVTLAITTFVVAGTTSIHQIKNAIPDAARPLPLSAVRLTGGPLKHAQD